MTTNSWGRLFVGVVCWGIGVPESWAESSFPISRTSSTTEQRLHGEALYLKEETISIAARHEQPISEAPSNVYVITDEDIRQSGAPDLPTLLRRVPGLEVMQMTGADFNVSVRGDNQPVANKLLVMVDGRSIFVDTQGSVMRFGYRAVSVPTCGQAIEYSRTFRTLLPQLFILPNPIGRFIWTDWSERDGYARDGGK